MMPKPGRFIVEVEEEEVGVERVEPGQSWTSPTVPGARELMMESLPFGHLRLEKDAKPIIRANPCPTVERFQKKNMILRAGFYVMTGLTNLRGGFLTLVIIMVGIPGTS